MPTIDKLLLSMGGGITVDEKEHCPQNKNSVSICIGIGGTGLAALAELKRKVYSQVEPDDPDAPVHNINRIRFLAIDSDETEREKLKRIANFNAPDEWFSICDYNMIDVFQPDKARYHEVKNSIMYDWFEVDKIHPLHSALSTGCVRQIRPSLQRSSIQRLQVLRQIISIYISWQVYPAEQAAVDLLIPATSFAMCSKQTAGT